MPTQAQLNAEINTNLASNNANAITAALLRSVLTDMTSAIFQTIGSSQLVGNYPSITGVGSLGATIAASLALGGASIGTNALAVTGNIAFNTNITMDTSSNLVVGNNITVVGLTTFFNPLRFNGSTQIGAPANGSIVIERNDASFQTNLTTTAANSLQFGLADSATPVAQTLQFQNGATLNTAGANATIIGSLSAGSGNSGDIIFQTGVKSGVSGTQATKTTALTIKGETQNVIIAGSLQVNTGGNASSVSANFVADHRLTVNINGTTWYLAASTTAW